MGNICLMVVKSSSLEKGERSLQSISLVTLGKILDKVESIRKGLGEEEGKKILKVAEEHNLHF